MERTIIAISGHLTSGKTTLAKAIIEAQPGFTRLALADALKDDVAEFCEVSREYLDANKADFREILQIFGVLMRQLHGENYWVIRLVDKVREYNLMNVIVDDVRFPNELSGLRKSADRFLSVRLDLTSEEQEKRCTTLFGAPLSYAKLVHPSETALDDCKEFDLTLPAIWPTHLQRSTIRAKLAVRKALANVKG